MIESKYYPDPTCIYNWTFKDNDSVVNNDRVKATKFGNPAFSGGVATFTLNDYYKFKSIINIGIKYTIAVKFKLDDISLPAAIRMLAGTNASAIYGFLINNSSQTVSHNTGGTLATISFTKDLNWHEFVVSRNGSSGKIYIDGVEQTITGSFSATVPLIFKTMIGTNDATPIGKIPGKLEYIRIWNRALTAYEVTNNYRGVTFKSLPYFSNEVLGSEMVVDGGFDDTTKWIKEASWTVSEGTANVNNTTGTDKFLYQPIGWLVNDDLYKITLIVDSVTGTLVSPYDGFTGIFLITSPGTYSFYYRHSTSSSPHVFIGAKNNTVASLSYLSVKRVQSSNLNTLFHINSYRGVIRDMVNKVTPVATNVLLKAIGSNVKVTQFNGSSGNINIGSNALIGDITVMCWINNNSSGEGGSGIVIASGVADTAYTLSITASNNYYLRRSNATPAYSGANTVKFQKWMFLVITSTSTGITNFYSGSNISSPVLIGTANQNVGTPSAGTTIYLGNNSGDNRTLNGQIGEMRVDASILSLNDITQFWSDTKSLYL